ncbi:tRNA (adenine(58)-N(1))-methyltransferase non-catalytic subunit trm6 [Diplonema papillatum]|nr:tRNA (adenine(58)-N(1))-methyltransferase non-catalytic subunit trm6 [Diplonema papillatum]
MAELAATPAACAEGGAEVEQPAAPAAVAAAPAGENAFVLDGDWAVLHLQDDRMFLTRVLQGSVFKQAKIPGVKEINLRPIIGLRWNQFVEYDTQLKTLVAGARVNLEDSRDVLLEKVQDEKAPGVDNRALLDNNTAQTADVERLRSLKMTGDSSAAIEVLVSGSKTFAGKTKFSQEKYIKKKQKRWAFFMQIRRPTIALLIEMWFARKVEKKILHMRVDTLAQLLNHSNVHAHNSTLLLDGCGGLVTAAVVQRQGGLGRVYNVVGTVGKGSPTCMCFEILKLESWAERCLVNVDVSRDVVVDIEALAKDAPAVEKSDKQLEREVPHDYRTVLGLPDALHELKVRRGVDCAVLASPHHPVESFMQLLPLLGGGCTFVVYSRYLETLVELSQLLRTQHIAVNVQLTETFWREHQVLPNRTHPFVNMSATGGFLLSGIVVQNAHPRSFWSTLGAAEEPAQNVAMPSADEPPAKKAKTGA